VLFNSLGFILFFIVVLALYHSRVLQWQQKKVMLLAASYIFYGLWNPLLVLILWFSTIVDWLVGNAMFKTEDVKRRKLLLLASICVNLGFLAFFKYGNFLVDNFAYIVSFFGVEFTPLKADIILPMGISFYTFQSMSYSIDIYRKQIKPAEKFTDFALYVTFFPQLVAGPIVRASFLLGQFVKPVKVSVEQFYWGLLMLTFGVFQKVVLADVILADVADKVFSAGAGLNPLDAWVGVLAFSGQIFFDFSGYSTCAIAIALTLGFVIPENFKSPYAAIGFSDFWQRWHISLSSWLRDYLYIPLGGNRLGLTRTHINLMITMTLGGLWHGASWNFVVWGGLHGLFLILERFFRARINFKINIWNGLVLALLTFVCINITWVFFRADTFTAAIDLLAAMFLLGGEGKMVLQQLAIAKVGVLMLGLTAAHWYMRERSLRSVIECTPSWLLGVIWAIMIVSLVIAQGMGQQFLYFQF